MMVSLGRMRAYVPVHPFGAVYSGGPDVSGSRCRWHSGAYCSRRMQRCAGPELTSSGLLCPNLRATTHEVAIILGPGRGESILHANARTSIVTGLVIFATLLGCA